jgi:hypothetical protein
MSDTALDTAPLSDAYRALLGAAATVAESGEAKTPPPGEWNADQILAHVAIITATTITAVSRVASGENATYDNRTSQDGWTISRVIARAGGNGGLRERIRVQGEALCTLAPSLREAELDTPVPTVLLSGGDVLVDQPVPVRDLVLGLAEAELPGHANQLLALLPSA